ncbi:MAG TPA: translation initiation factor IF-2 [Bacteroidota bacterium]|nr:translation initiation factor IF-2 [Bacteroidota bacterium]
MAETVEKKKKLYKVATELNLSHETVIEFLRKKGHEVKNHMSTLDEAMMHEILVHFKKEKDSAEKHQRKIQEIRDQKKKTEKKPEAAPDHVPIVQSQLDLTPSKGPAHEEGTGVDEAVPAVAPGEVTLEDREPGLSESPAATPTTAPVEEVQAEAPPVEQREEPAELADAAPAEEPGVKPPAPKKPEYLSPLEKERRARVGLTIKGRMDLKPKVQPGAAARPARGEAATARTAKGGAPTAATTETEEAHKRKKKKKKVREETGEVAAGHTEEAAGDKKKKKKKKLRHKPIDQSEVDDAIKRTFAAMDDTPVSGRATLRRRKRREREEEEQRLQEEALREEGKLKVTEFVSVNDLANLMHVNVADVIKKCMELGIMVSINQRLEKDTIQLVADEFGFEVQFYSDVVDEELVDETEDKPEDLQRRPPVVTIMGHVDHGKTSLLDYIRRSNVVAGESGGITQHIGAYEVTTSTGNTITFLDTPGHEAFTAMRARGAQITDIVVLVVAADDSVMPQTLEAISHAQAANVPIIIAINKIDKPESNPDRIRQQLAERNILVEEWGGKYQCVELSARTGKNVDLLLEKISLEADVLDLKANPHRLAFGTIVEAQLDKGKGVTATALVQKGTLRVGDPFLAGVFSGKVRAMFDERGNRLESAGPSAPVQLTGLDGFPQAGDPFIVMESDREAREISLRRQQLKREQDFRQIHLTTLDDISEQIKQGGVKELAVIVKGDVDGSVEALSDSLMKTAHKEVKLRVIHSGVGMISESDVILAAASNAVIIGFRVRPNLNARRLAEKEKVDIRMYTIIYDAIDDVHQALEGLLSPEKKEEIIGTAEVREIFKVPRIGNIAGCHVQDGKIARNNKVRLVRDGIQIFDGAISSLKRFKDDVREVEAGFECGIGLENYNDMKPGDVVEAYRIVESKRKLTT